MGYTMKRNSANSEKYIIVFSVQIILHTVAKLDKAEKIN